MNCARTPFACAYARRGRSTGRGIYRLGVVSSHRHDLHEGADHSTPAPVGAIRLRNRVDDRSGGWLLSRVLLPRESNVTLEVIGAGFGRTGTLSLKVALEKLGFEKCYHMTEVFQHPEHVPMWAAAQRGERVDWDALYQGYRSTVDWPSC